MAATFREVTAYSGVDENLPTGGQGIVVPSGGSTLVILQDGRGLDVRSTIPSKVYVYEFKTGQERAGAVRNASNTSNLAARTRQRSTVFRRRQTPSRCRSCLRDFWTNVIQDPR